MCLSLILGGFLLNSADSVCNCTVQLQKVNNEVRKETQTSISSVRKEIDALRNVTKLLLGQYVQPTDPKSMITVHA